MYVVSSLKWLISNVSYTLQPSDTPLPPRAIPAVLPLPLPSASAAAFSFVSLY